MRRAHVDLGETFCCGVVHKMCVSLCLCINDTLGKRSFLSVISSLDSDIAERSGGGADVGSSTEDGRHGANGITNKLLDFVSVLARPFQYGFLRRREGVGYAPFLGGQTQTNLPCFAFMPLLVCSTKNLVQSQQCHS